MRPNNNSHDHKRDVSRGPEYTEYTKTILFITLEGIRDKRTQAGTYAAHSKI